MKVEGDKGVTQSVHRRVDPAPVPLLRSWQAVVCFTGSRGLVSPILRALVVRGDMR
jgi:hypothetical protein